MMYKNKFITWEHFRMSMAAYIIGNFFFIAFLKGIIGTQLITLIIFGCSTFLFPLYFLIGIFIQRSWTKIERHDLFGCTHTSKNLQPIGMIPHMWTMECQICHKVFKEEMLGYDPDDLAYEEIPPDENQQAKIKIDLI